MVNTRVHSGDLVPPIEALEGYMKTGGASILRAAFDHSFFVDPARVRAKTPYFPERARMSREHYPNKGRGDTAIWNGRDVILGDNAYAQQAWQRYTGRAIFRGSGYSVRHIWGNPWNPDAFTAGWNLCYMPFWAGRLTEKQHPHPELRQAVRQASWDLFFRDNPVTTTPDFVEDPGMDLGSVLAGQQLLILTGDTKDVTAPVHPTGSPASEVFERVRDIRRHTHQSWSNICKAVRLLRGERNVRFGTKNVEASSKSTVRRIQREANLSLAKLESLLKEHNVWRTRAAQGVESAQQIRGARRSSRRHVSAEGTKYGRGSNQASYRSSEELFERVKEVRKKTNRSWSNICKAVRLLRGERNVRFGTKNVEASSKSTVRRIQREVNLGLAELETLLKDHGVWK